MVIVQEGASGSAGGDICHPAGAALTLSAD